MPSKFRTSWGIALGRILPEELELVTNYDKERYEAKRCHPDTRRLSILEKYESLITSKLQEQLCEFRIKIRGFDKQNLKGRGVIPTTEKFKRDMDKIRTLKESAENLLTMLRPSSPLGPRPTYIFVN